MAERRLRPPRRALALAAAVPALWLATPSVCRHLEYFRVRRIEFVGMTNLEPARATAALALPSSASVFDDGAPLERRLLAIRGVRSASVGRRLPGTLVVTLEEWPPVALVPQGDHLALMDQTGRVLPFDPARSAPDLPLAPAPDATLGRLLAVVLAAEPALFARVGTAWRAGGDVMLEVDGRRLWFGPTASAEEVRAVAAVAEDLARQRRDYRELDGRFAAQVIVRGGPV